MLEDLDSQDISTKDELMEYAHELWKTTSQFEKELKHSLKGHELEMKKLKFSTATRIEWIKHKTSYYITVHEETLRMTKEKYIREIENLEMKLCDLESKLLRQELQKSELDRILSLDVSEITDIDEVKKIVTKLQDQSIINLRTITNQEFRINSLETSLSELKQKYQDNFDVKELYEGVVAKMMCPPMKIVDINTFSKYRTIAAKDQPGELLEFLKTSKLDAKIPQLSEYFLR